MINIIIIHDVYITSGYMYKMLSDHNFTPFVFSPMSTISLKKVLKRKHFMAFPEAKDQDRALFDNLFHMLCQQLGKQTVNIKRWLYVLGLVFKPY